MSLLENQNILATSLESDSDNQNSSTLNFDDRDIFQTSLIGGSNNLVEIEAEEYHKISNTDKHEWSVVEENASSGQALQATPDIGANINNNYVENSPQLDYTINFKEAGNYYAWVFGRAAGKPQGHSDSIHLGLNGQEVESAERISNFSNDYSWSNTTMDNTDAMIEILTPGIHTLNLWMREDGFMVDRIVLTTDANYDPQSRKLPNVKPFVHSNFQQNDNGSKFIEIEAEQYLVQTIPSLAKNKWVLNDDNQASGNKSLITDDLGVINQTNYQNASPRLDYSLEFDETGRYYVWMLGKANNGNISHSNSVHVGFNQQSIDSAERISGFSDEFTWSNQTMDKTNPFIDVDSTGWQTVNLWMREDGFNVDKFILTTDTNFDPIKDIAIDATDDEIPISRKKPSANVSYDNPPLSNEVWNLSWGAGQGLAPELLFWEEVPEYQELEQVINDVSSSIEAQGKVPVTGLQLWKSTFERSQPGGDYSELPGHQAWVKWIEERPEYLGVDRNGEEFGWGYVSPLVPLKPEDYPEDFEGDVAYYADWQAEKLGRLAAFTGINGFMNGDFFDAHPHTGPFKYFNSLIIDDFEKRTGITLSSSAITEQANEIRLQYSQEWLDYWVDRWAYNFSAIDREIRQHTGEEPWLLNQTSFPPSIMRRYGAVDPRVILQYMSPDNITFVVQSIQGFRDKKSPLPESLESAKLGLHAAREPEAYYGQIVQSSEPGFWKSVEIQWPDLSQEVREELGWKRLKRTWLESGWTHIATRQGDVRRAAESWTRGYHNQGKIDESWVELLRDIDPARPFGPALYYSVSIESAYETEAGGTGNPANSPYLGIHLEPVTDLKETGVPFNYYVSDAALDELQDDYNPSAWIIPDRYLKGEDVLPLEERQSLEKIAPILSEEEAQSYDYPLSFTSDQEGRTINGFGFYDRNDRLIVVASDRITIGEDNNDLGAVKATVNLKLPDGNYVARNLLNKQEIEFKVTSGSGKFTTTIDRWDTQVLEIVPN